MINGFLELLQTGLLQALVLALVALGVMIPFRVLNFPDLTAEGAYPLGGAVCATMVIMGYDPIIATLIATISAGLLGVGTAFIHLRLKINTLLAGIIISTMVYSINLKLMNKPNLSLFEYKTLFLGISEELLFKIIILLMINLSIILLLYKFLFTEKGLRFRATGLNPEFAERQGVNLSQYVYLGLFLGNALNGFAGSIMVQIQGYADVSMGMGMLIHALAALMIGESIMGSHTLLRQIIAPIIGAFIYQQIQGIVMSLGLAPSDLKIMTGMIVLLSISYKQVFKK